MTRPQHRWSYRGAFAGLILGALQYVVIAGSILGDARGATDETRKLPRLGSGLRLRADGTCRR